jgi:tetratricopeptide (TPR) repeat protein
MTGMPRLCIARVLAFDARSEKEPNSAQHRQDISISLNNIGGALLARWPWDLFGAAAAYREALDIVRKLAAERPDKSAAWQAYLTFSANKIGAVAFFFILDGNFSQSLELSDEAISVAPKMGWLHANRAHALMLLGRVDQARAIYLQYRGTQDVRNNKPWETVVLEDFAELRKANLTHPLMVEIEKTFRRRRPRHRRSTFSSRAGARPRTKNSVERR